MLTYKSIPIKINKHHQLYNWCKTICTESKGIIDYATYIRRQNFFEGSKSGNHKSEKELSKLFRDTVNKQQLGHTQLTTTLWNKTKSNWFSFYTMLKNGLKPHIPNYLKHNGKQFGYIEYHIGQNNSPARIKNNTIYFNGTHKNKLKLNMDIQGTIKTILINYTNGSFWIHINYQLETEINMNDPQNVASIDIGINNLLTVTFNNGHKPLIISGKLLKSINQYYNKQKAKLQSKLETSHRISNRINRLTEKRNLKINDIKHVITKQLSQLLNERRIGTLIIGWNKESKSQSNMSKTNNQKFISIPHRSIINSLKDKCKLFLNVVETEESYTSKSSFIDQDELPIFDKTTISKYRFSGSRIKRGLYKSKTGLLINADVNGSYNIMRKAIPNVILRNKHGIEGFIVDPLRISNPYKLSTVLHESALPA